LRKYLQNDSSERTPLADLESNRGFDGFARIVANGDRAQPPQGCRIMTQADSALFTLWVWVAALLQRKEELQERVADLEANAQVDKAQIEDLQIRNRCPDCQQDSRDWPS
jgi:hypothetical protein